MTARKVGGVWFVKVGRLRFSFCRTTRAKRPGEPLYLLDALRRDLERKAGGAGEE